MKKLKFIAMAAFLISATTVAFMSCSDDDDDDPVVVNPTSIEFEAAGGKRTVNVSGDWNAQPKSGADWLVLSEQTSTSFVATAKANAGVARETTIQVGDKIVEVSQKAAPGKEEGKLEFEAAGGTQSVKISGEWNETVDCKVDWLKITKVTASGFDVTAVPNDGEERTASIKAGNKTIAVIQKAATAPEEITLSVDPKTLDFTAKPAAGQKVTVTTNADSWDATAKEDWITIKKSDKSFDVTVSENTEGERTGTITVTAKDYKGSAVTITVKQEKGTKADEGEYEYEFEDYIGEWTINALRCRNGVETPYTGTFTIEDLEHADYPTYYWAEALPFDEFEGTDEVGFVLFYEDGNLCMNVLEGLYKVNNGAYILCSLLGNNSSGKYAAFDDGNDALYVATPEAGELVFKDNGEWGTDVVDGFGFILLTPQGAFVDEWDFWKDIKLSNKKTTSVKRNSSKRNLDVKLSPNYKVSNSTYWDTVRLPSFKTIKR